MSEIFAVLILVVWLFLVISLSWSEKSRPLVNIAIGIIMFAIMGMFYLVPFWLVYLH